MPSSSKSESTRGGRGTGGESPSRQTSLHVDTKEANLNAKAANPSSSGSGRGTVNPSPAQDSHPYQRGSVIEVWHVSKSEAAEDWWSGPDDSSSEEENSDANTNTKRSRTIRLCDIVDRAQVNGQWRYYVHYRDFNRRMDEWISVDKIVSPPSIGNAKARAIKKEEERQKKKRLEKTVDGTVPRSRRRVSAIAAEENSAIAAAAASLASEDSATGGIAVDAGAGAAGAINTATLATTATVTSSTTPIAAVPAATTRKRRQSRRKGALDGLDDDAATVTASNMDGTDLQREKTLGTSNHNNKKETIALPTDVVTTHTFGEHVVATVKAQELDEHEGLDEASLREHEEVTKVKNVRFLELGEFQMETWYFTPLPKELLGPEGFLDVLYVCEFTFAMFARKCELRRHQSRLFVQNRHPPGNEIYRKGNLSMFEVDGLIEKIYCQNLCYIAKLFLDHKTLYYDVDPFLFYVLCELDDRGFHPVGYYSKEKYSDVGYNLACILTFPAHQRKGYGRFLIAFSYELSKKEEKVGSPEKPMSDLGQQAYKPYWASTIVDFLLNQSTESHLNIMEISKKTSIMAEDIVFTLNQLGILKIINGVYFVVAESGLLLRLAKKYPIKEPRVDPSRLHWTPFLMDIKRDKFSIHSKKSSVEADGIRGNGGV